MFSKYLRKTNWNELHAQTITNHLIMMASSDVKTLRPFSWEVESIFCVNSSKLSANEREVTIQNRYMTSQEFGLSGSGLWPVKPEPPMVGCNYTTSHIAAADSLNDSSSHGKLPYYYSELHFENQNPCW